MHKTSIYINSRLIIIIMSERILDQSCKVLIMEQFAIHVY